MSRERSVSNEGVTLIPALWGLKCLLSVGLGCYRFRVWEFEFQGLK